MSRGVFRCLSLALAILFLAAGAVFADNLSLVNGGTVTGSFVYDATTNTVVSFDFTTTAGGGFGNESFIGPVSGSSGAVVLTNQDGDQAFGFDSVQSNGDVDELDIVLSCNGVANCAEQAVSGDSFAVTAGPDTYPSASCPNLGTTTGFCIASGLQNNVPGGLAGDLIGPGNFVTITDPACPSTDHCFSLTLATASTGTVFNGSFGGGNNNGGGGTPGVPEPSTLVLSALGFAGFALKRAIS